MNLLLTSVGRRSYLVDYFKSALHGTGEVHVSNSSSLTPAFLCADYGTETPLIYSDEYIPFLLSYCQKHCIDAIISLLDMDLPILAANREKFETIGTKLIVSNSEVISVCNDKWNTYNFLRSNGFNAPNTWIDLDELKTHFKGHLPFPLIVKPRWGMGSIGIYEADNELELEVFYNKVKQAIFKSPLLKYEAAQDYEQCVIIQEKIDGQEYGIDVINDLNKNYQTTIVRRKIAMRAGETDCAQIEDIPEIKALGEQLSKTLGHIANLDVDVFLKNGKPYILEMNARFGGGYPFSHLAGVDLPQAIVNWLRGETLQAELLDAKTGVIGHKDLAIRKLN